MSNNEFEPIFPMEAPTIQNGLALHEIASLFTFRLTHVNLSNTRKLILKPEGSNYPRVRSRINLITTAERDAPIYFRSEGLIPSRNTIVMQVGRRLRFEFAPRNDPSYLMRPELRYTAGERDLLLRLLDRCTNEHAYPSSRISRGTFGQDILTHRRQANTEILKDVLETFTPNPLHNISSLSNF